MRPYKYAGYPQLIKTIRLETKDEQLFSKEVPLLTAASELCYHTVHCSVLNAEELRRENGIEVETFIETRRFSIFLMHILVIAFIDSFFFCHLIAGSFGSIHSMCINYGR